MMMPLVLMTGDGLVVAYVSGQPLAIIALVSMLIVIVQVSRFGGMSESVAVLVTTSVVSSLMVRFVWAGNTGAVFTSFTVTLKLLVADNDGMPLSETMVVMI